MQSRSVRWAIPCYILVSLAAITWLSISLTSMRTFRDKTLATQTALLGNSLLGAIQNLDAVSKPDGKSSEDLSRLLVNAEASLAQVEIATLGYEQVSGNRIPLGSLVGSYAAQLRLVREELGRAKTLAPESLKAVVDVKSDLELLRSACKPDILIHGSQEAITLLFENTAGSLKVR